MTDEDWGILFPQNPVKIGAQTLNIQPLTLEAYGTLTSLFQNQGFKDRLAERGIDQGNVEERIPQLVGVLLEITPETVELATGLNREDVAKLPMPDFFRLVNEVVRVNLEAQEDLEKNWWALVVGAIQMIRGALRTPSSSSSSGATASTR